MTDPRTVIGVPLYNNADSLPRALESLLSQSFGDVGLVLVDDASTDATGEVAARYVRADPRLSYHRNPSRLGMIGNWRRSFQVSRARFPGSEYFAWASDHDFWHPRWLSSLVRRLDAHPEAVLAYPRTLRFADTGTPIKAGALFETVGIERPTDRLVATWWGMTAGDMIYGLYRARSLEKTGLLRPVLLPDRLLIAELALQGPFVQVEEMLWYRHMNKTFSYDRQRAAFFPHGAPPHSYLPWWVVHPCVLAWSLVVRGSARPSIGRAQALPLVATYVRLVLTLELKRQERHLDRVKSFGTLGGAIDSIRRQEPGVRTQASGRTSGRQLR